MTSFVSGVRAFFDGLATLAATPRLWPLALAPIAIAALAFAGGVWGGIALVHWAAGHWLAHWTGVLAPLRFIALALGYAIGVLASFVAAEAVILPIAASPFLTAISEAVEVLATRRKPAPLPLGESVRALAHALATSLFGLLVLVAFLPLLLLPGIGALLYLAPTAYVAALAALDATFARKGLTLGAKRAWLRENSGAALGFGGAMIAVNLVPLVGLVAVPAAAAGGALLIVRKEIGAIAVPGR